MKNDMNFYEDNTQNVARSGNRKKKKKIKVGRVIMLLVVVLGIAITAVACSGGNLPYTEKTIEVPQGYGTKAVASLLEENGIIGSKLSFEIAAKMNGYDGKFKYGTYELNSEMTFDEMMEILSSGTSSANTVTVTIPEGYTIKQIGERLEEAGLFSKEDFYEAVKTEKFNYDFLSDTPEGDNYLEGFLFPNTYEFYQDATPRNVIKAMLDSFEKNFDPGDIAKAKSLVFSNRPNGFTYNEVITIASIIEREVKEPSERAMVAGVIYNRLNSGQKLEMCSTIQYILGEQHDRLYEADLQIESPYNTYMYAGLPIGPIANPGAASIEAALNPVKHNYYYFVLMDEQTGKHHFSTTYAEHVNAKNKYIK